MSHFTHAFSRAWQPLHVCASRSDWFIGLIAFIVIGLGLLLSWFQDSKLITEHGSLIAAFLAGLLSSQESLSRSTVHTKRHQFKPKKTKHVIVKQNKVTWSHLRRHKTMTSDLSNSVISTGKQVEHKTNRLDLLKQDKY